MGEKQLSAFVLPFLTASFASFFGGSYGGNDKEDFFEKFFSTSPAEPDPTKTASNNNKTKHIPVGDCGFPIGTLADNFIKKTELANLWAYDEQQDTDFRPDENPFERALRVEKYADVRKKMSQANLFKLGKKYQRDLQDASYLSEKTLNKSLWDIYSSVDRVAGDKDPKEIENLRKAIMKHTSEHFTPARCIMSTLSELKKQNEMIKEQQLKLKKENKPPLSPVVIAEKKTGMWQAYWA